LSISTAGIRLFLFPSTKPQVLPDLNLAASVDMTVQPGEVTLVPTGLVIAVPKGHVLGSLRAAVRRSSAG
jgi:dUTPase